MKFELIPGSPVVFRKQKSDSPYKDTNEDKLKVLDILDTKFQEAIKVDNTTLGTKNLIYFATYGNNYSTLLEQCLTSIYNYCKIINFDILIITDANTSKIIKSKEIIKKFNCNYFIVDTPEDGIAASMTKMLINKYYRINEYGKVLFLDTDIVFAKDVQEIFDIELGDKMEVVEAFTLRDTGKTFYKDKIANLYSLYSGLSFFTEKNEKFIEERDPNVFSAGHFLYRNTKQMQAHFENVNWLISVWPGPYFFEQSFLNQYFIFNDLVTYGNLSSRVEFITFLQGPYYDEPTVKRHKDEHVFLHFAGQPINGAGKLQYIQYYCKAHSICL